MSSGALQDVTGGELEPGYVQQRVEDWVNRIEVLFREVEGWLPSDWKSRRTGPVRMHEELMQRYGLSSRDLPVLEITKANGSQLTLEPRGLWIIGANGRVDLNGARQFVIVDTAEPLQGPEWKIAPLSDRQDLKPLSKTTFLGAA